MYGHYNEGPQQADSGGGGLGSGSVKDRYDRITEERKEKPEDGRQEQEDRSGG